MFNILISITVQQFFWNLKKVQICMNPKNLSVDEVLYQIRKQRRFQIIIAIGFVLIMTTSIIIDSAHAFNEIKLDKSYKIGWILAAAINTPMSVFVIYWIVNMLLMLDVYLKALSMRTNLNLCCSRFLLMIVGIPLIICFLFVMILNIYPLPRVLRYENCSQIYSHML